MAELRVVDSCTTHPHRTGALDEALLRSRAGGRCPDTLHFYRREPPAVSLGYFGKAGAEVDIEYCRENGILLLRRLSGGSAIYTDVNSLGYALVSKDILPSRPNDAYRKVCGALVKAMQLLGVEAEYKPVNDVQHGGRKLSGSALARRWGAQLMHGSILVEVDRARMFAALRVPGEKLRSKGLAEPGARVTSLAEVLGRAPPMEKVKAAVVEAIGERFDLEPRSGKLTGEEGEMAGRLVKEKYGTDGWNLKRP
jgi:lipoate-protein ligase A